MSEDEMRLPEAADSIQEDVVRMPEPVVEGRGHRLRRPSRKAQYMMPEGPGVLLDPEEGESFDNEPESFAQVAASDLDVQVAPRRRVTLRLVYKTAPNCFGLWREYSGDKPETAHDIPGLNARDLTNSLQQPIERNTSNGLRVERRNKMLQVISPFPNLSMFRLAHFSTLYQSKSQTFEDGQQEFVLRAPNFDLNDAAVCSLAGLTKSDSRTGTNCRR